MNVSAFLSYIVLTSITPGPNNIMSMTNAAKYGLKRGFRFCLGVALGFLIDMTLLAVFTSLLFHYIPQIEPVMKWVGAAYILFLAVSIVWDRPHQEGKGNRLRPDSFWTGVLMQFVNVKVILYGITALTNFILPHYQSVPALLLFVLLLTLTGMVGNCSWTLFGAVFQKLFTRYRKPLNVIMALLLVYCALSLLIR